MPSGGTPLPIPRTGMRLLDPDDSATMLADTPIETESQDVPLSTGMVPGEVIRYRDRRMSAALLRYVWQSQYALRHPMITWLDGLSRDPRTNVRLRAAQAAGLICSLDFTHTFDALIRPAAEARPDVRPVADVENDDQDDEDFDASWQYRRYFAAVAMDHVARDPRLRKAVRGQLSRWRRSDDPALRWTAAIALGYDVGARTPDNALNELRVLGTPWEARRYRELEASASSKRARALTAEEEVFHAAGSGVAGLFRYGAHREVLDQLRAWIDDPHSSVRLLAVQAVIYIMGTTVSAVGRPETRGPAVSDELVADSDRQDRARWPVLLAMHGRQNPVERPAADLVRRALRSKDRKVALEVLGGWFASAGEDGDVLAAVEAFLPLLVVEESDRGRLRGLVKEMRHRWEEPLPGLVADRLDDALVRIRTIAGRKVFV